MSRRRSAVIAPLAAAAGVLVAAGVGRAQPNDQPIRVEYRAPAECPTREAFFAQVQQRAPRVRRAAEGAGARSFDVSIAKDEGRVRGHLVVRDPAGAEAERDVTGDTCEQVVAALALITALAVEASSSSADAAGPTSSPPGEGPDASPAPSTESGPRAVAPLPLAAPPETPARRRTGERSAPDAGERGRGWHLAVGADGALVGGVSPRVVVGVPVFVEAVAPAASDGWSLFSPAIRAGFVRASSGSIDTQGATAEFTWTVGILEACPMRWTYGAFELEPCLRAEAGVLEGAGFNIVPARDVTRPWVDVGAAGRAEWFLLPPLFVELEAALRVPLVRTRYFFEPDATVYEPPLLGGLVAAGLGVRFL